jgi:Domain of unknown function (DUF4262)
MSHDSRECACLACSNPRGREGAVDAVRQKLREGTPVVVPVIPRKHTADDSDDDDGDGDCFCFAYTIGMHSLFDQPELIIAIDHLDPLVIAEYLAQIAEEFQEHPHYWRTKEVPDVFRVVNRKKQKTSDPDEIKLPVGCVSVSDEDFIRECMGVAKTIYGTDVEFPVRQIIMPDLDGKLPWHENCDKSYHGCQRCFAHPADMRANSENVAAV